MIEDKMKTSIEFLKAAFKKYPGKKVIAFTGGKDSVLMLELTMMAFGKIPCDVFYIDSGLDHEETVEFIEEARKHWGFKLVKFVHKPTLKKFHASTDHSERGGLARELKIETIKMVVKAGYDVMMVGIRWDEHESRSKEAYCVDWDDHSRIHPILHFKEKDVWKFIKKYKTPCNPLYKQGYRSLGEKEFTKKVRNPFASERSGRDPEKEKIMKRLRQLGYF